MSDKYSFYLVEVDGDDYAAMTLENMEGGIEKYLRQALKGKDQFTIDDIEINITYTLFEFDTKEDKEKAISVAHTCSDLIDYDFGKTHNIYVVEL